MILLIKALK